MSGQNDINSMISVIRSGAPVSREEYERNQAKIEQLKAVTASLEVMNAGAYKKTVEQDLLQRVQEGRQAEYVVLYGPVQEIHT